MIKIGQWEIVIKSNVIEGIGKVKVGGYIIDLSAYLSVVDGKMKFTMFTKVETNEKTDELPF